MRLRPTPVITTQFDYEKLRFVHRTPGGSVNFGQYNRVTGPVSSTSGNNNSGWTRYHHTFTTGMAGSYRVGFSAPYFTNSWTRIWGTQLEKGSSPTRYTYTRQSIVTSTATTTEFADPRSRPIAIRWKCNLHRPTYNYSRNVG